MRMSSLQGNSPKSLQRPVLLPPRPLQDPQVRPFCIFSVLTHPLPAPLAGAALILNAIAALDRRLDSFERQMAIASLHIPGIEDN
jgi:hypothetical protein